MKKPTQRKFAEYSALLLSATFLITTANAADKNIREECEILTSGKTLDPIERIFTTSATTDRIEICIRTQDIEKNRALADGKYFKETLSDGAYRTTNQLLPVTTPKSTNNQIVSEMPKYSTISQETARSENVEINTVEGFKSIGGK